ncbi:ZZ-type zinc finger-containing protein 3 [Bufo gargarizans]|uniref:ZZ-type zinc finger-containing protein 3 n=1 Tax=Bufo gargarizans TaxID=30331 RepID=UPI001CF5E805|nr:ZZ-type zinc finger-containing protein 3 [Bufo gargarizans]XP_044156402.1 ZZ-type zinc finger-containing protein 3 [Bufo gargarizans]XP_044156403.1 ZZ-type zinc finger-containing protein 3 [Bufo gargarizans]
MAASRSTRVTRSTVGLNGLDESFCGRTLRNRSIAPPDEVVPPSLLRSRSPKKRPEPAPVQKATIPKGGEVKQSAPREPWVSPRKRGLSVSEKDSNEKDSVENSDKKSSSPLSPVLKKIKRYLRSEEPGSPEDESPSTLPKEPLERRNSESDNEAETPRPKRTHRCLLLDDSHQREVKTDAEPEEILKNALPDGGVLNHQAVNGIDNETAAAAVNCNNCPSDGGIKQNSTSTFPLPKELIVSENGRPLTPCPAPSKKDVQSDHNVPCTHSEEQAQDHEIVNNCINQTNEAAGPLGTDPLSTVRDSEEELDVVGDSLSKEQNRAPSPAQDKSAELDSPGSEGVASPETCFSDTQEHRYTLRTSPRRPASARDSPSVCGENGQVEEVGGEYSGSMNGSGINLEEAGHDDKKQSCPIKCSQEKPTAERAAASSRESGSAQPAEEEDEEPDVYFFESDHVALKHNKDYQRLLQTISVLEAQRSQAVLDVERLSEQQRDALTDPIGFVETLQKKMDLGIPRPQRIVQLPEISWDQYTTTLGNFEREFRNRKRNSRRVKLIFDKVGLHASSQRAGDKEGESSSYSVLPQSDSQESSASSVQIRGRLCMDSKPGTFNQLWTVEEQRKLEQLLLKFPPEEIESKRWQKIADELGNRTAKQVASRVQKYFIKLTKAGIPVPGRTPNLYMYSKKASSKRQHVLNKHLFKPSTFMTSHEPPVFMEEDDDHSSRDLDAAADDDEEDVSDEETIPASCRGLAEYKELLELKKLKKQRLQEMEAEIGFVQHVGFKCDNCGTEPIQGIRWHCQDCPQQMSVDFCDSCSDCLYETQTHKEDHHLEPVYKAETFLDRDYCMPHSTSYNYLDPNYFPANR